ncbi:hypothetical protein C7B79_36395 [Chroococcidiopsis cubana CCALA 043]|uniref:hypothetical protein n=1 Tax=Chroococcidiopsis cubana TaxID=171392 RepID=UPI000D04DBF6|nr:hypothetical protein [Chroococcidiopsis cubana]PSB51276.1 hypothetical protein C7B79_36395 [Chroococcidiopsis cubana CCALA 043]
MGQQDSLEQQRSEIRPLTQLRWRCFVCLKQENCKTFAHQVLGLILVPFSQSQASKKIPQTNAIFDHIQANDRQADNSIKRSLHRLQSHSQHW